MPELRAVQGAAADRRTGVSVLLFLIGLGLGSGQLWGGLYAISVWGPVAILTLIAFVATLVAVPRRPSVPAQILIGCIAGYALLSALSMIWAESSPAAALEAHRWGFYAALAAVPALLIQQPRDRYALVGGLAAAGVAVTLGVVVILWLGNASSLFVVMRLTEPLGYVNGQAAAFVLAAWPCLAVAERARQPWLRAIGAVLGALAVGLVVLAQSRGGVLALVVSAVFVLAVVPGRLARGWLLLLIVGCVAPVASTLVDVYSSPSSPQLQPADGVVHHALGLLVLASLVAGLIWGIVSWAAAREQPPERTALLTRVSGAVLVGLVVVGLVGGLVAANDPLGRIQTQYDEFTSLQIAGTDSTRLFAGGGNRYDFWRVALDEFKDNPLGGVGAGNYTRDYFRLRRGNENVRQPHSIEMQALSELGIGGFLLILGVLGSLVAACVGGARALRAKQANPVLVLTVTGMIIAWVVQTSVDWLHLLPSLTGAVLCAALALMPAARPAGPRRMPAVIAITALVILGAAGIGRLTLADHFRANAEEQLASDPDAALDDTTRSLQLQGSNLSTLYIRAAAYARLDDYDGARETLEDAIAAEPHAFIPHVLLGDLATRRGDIALAARQYRRAIALNPVDASIRKSLAEAEAQR